eukprot:Lankesteria_metandrocarpae@DN843_c0_g1_i1.p1
MITMDGKSAMIDWGCKSAIAHSSTEAKIAVVARAIRACLPTINIARHILADQSMPVCVATDSASAVAILRKEYSRELSYMAKTHTISIGGTAQIMQAVGISITHMDGSQNLADTFTKPLPENKFREHTATIGVISETAI